MGERVSVHPWPTIQVKLKLATQHINHTKMFTNILINTMIAITSFAFGVIINDFPLPEKGAQEEKDENHILQQKNAILERENEEIRAANEGWYNKSIKDTANAKAAMLKFDEVKHGLYMCITVLSSLIAVNASCMFMIMVFVK